MLAKRTSFRGTIWSTMPLDTPIGPIPTDFTRARTVTPEVAEAIDDAFEYHAWTPEQIAAGSRIRTALADAVIAIVKDSPPSPDRSAAIRKCREARMDANSAITHGGKY
jgi:hypothetical protein